MVKVNISLDHVDSSGTIFTMTVVEDPTNAASGSYRVEINKPVTVDIPEPTTLAAVQEDKEQGDI